MHKIHLYNMCLWNVDWWQKKNEVDIGVDLDEKTSSLSSCSVSCRSESSTSFSVGALLAGMQVKLSSGYLEVHSATRLSKFYWSSCIYSKRNKPDEIEHHWWAMSRVKGHADIFGILRPLSAQVSLRIQAVWPGPTLFANKPEKTYSFVTSSFLILIQLHGRARQSWSTPSRYSRKCPRALFAMPWHINKFFIHITAVSWFTFLDILDHVSC